MISKATVLFQNKSAKKTLTTQQSFSESVTPGPWLLYQEQMQCHLLYGLSTEDVLKQLIKSIKCCLTEILVTLEMHRLSSCLNCCV